MRQRITSLLLFIGLFVAIGHLHAADPAGYMIVGPSYVISDADRLAQNAIGLKIGVGLSVNPSFNLEFSGVGDTLKQEKGGQAYEQKGWQLDGVYFFKRSQYVLPYGVVGMGVMISEFANQQKTTPLINGGVGILTPLFNNRIFLRADWRYRYEHSVDPLGRLQSDSFIDQIVHLNLVFPWGKKPMAAEGSPHTPPSKPLPPVAPTILPPAPVVEDRDKDQVPDNRDKCPSTPFGASINERGCELDNDNDGVVNSQDRCPDSSLGVKGDHQGCPLPVRSDQDGDGVTDDADRCPETPLGTIVDTKGCEPSGDTFSLLEQVTRCLQSPTDGSEACEIPDVIVLQGVEFDPKSNRLRPGSDTVLDKVAQLLKHDPDLVVEVAGYSDNLGSVASNTALSKKRAETVSRYLVLHGVLEANLLVKGYGPEKPIADNSTPEGRAINRRIELHILGR